ncbi:MAG: DUF1772 domain-containing protein [Hellea sp.]|nr:DUF1772 domain-containing protein [Hellea sp.]
MLEILTTLTTAFIGLYAGSLLTEGMILVPYWQRMSAADFFGGHSKMGPSLFRYFAPLTVLAVMLSVATALFAGGRHVWVAGLCLTALAIFFRYFKKANASFADHSLADEDLPAELKRWSAWHWTRTVIMMAALLVSISA